MDLTAALKASPHSLVKRPLDDGTAYLIEVVYGEYCVSTLDADGNARGFYRYDDYEMPRMHKRLGELEHDGWEPMTDVPSLKERQGRPYASTLPASTQEATPTPAPEETIVWAAASDPDAYDRWGDSLCDRCRNMAGRIWIVSTTGPGSAQNCISCMAGRLAEVIGTTEPQGLEPLVAYASTIRVTRNSRGEEGIEIQHFPDE